MVIFHDKIVVIVNIKPYEFRNYSLDISNNVI